MDDPGTVPQTTGNVDQTPEEARVVLTPLPAGASPENHPRSARETNELEALHRERDLAVGPPPRGLIPPPLPAVSAPLMPREFEAAGLRFHGQEDGSVLIRTTSGGDGIWRVIASISAAAWLELVARTSWSGCTPKDAARLLQTKGGGLQDKLEVEVLRARLEQALTGQLNLAVRQARVAVADVVLALAGASALVLELAGCRTAASIVLASAVGLVVLGKPVVRFLVERLAGVRPVQPR